MMPRVLAILCAGQLACTRTDLAAFWPRLEATQCEDLATPLCTDLVALYHFDEANGALDSSGNGNHGSCTTCPAFSSSAGAFGGAFVYDGDSHFEIPDHPSLDVTGAVTVSAWFYPHAMTDELTVVVAKIQWPDLASNYWLGHSEAFVVSFYDDGWQNQLARASWPLQRWYHLVGVIDDDEDRVRLYINGVPIINAVATAPMHVENGGLWIGWGPGDRGVDGVIDEVAIWRRALTEAEVKELYGD